MPIINTKLLSPANIAVIVAITIAAHFLLAPVFRSLNNGQDPD